METDEQLTAFRDQHQAWQRDTIRRHGWAVTAVLGDDHEPPFAYTVGLSGFGHPELVVFGLLQAVSGRLLNDYGERVRAGERLVPGERRVDPLVGLPMRLIEVTDSVAAGLLDANAVYRDDDGSPIPALQIVISDAAARFPWDPGFSIPRWLQPLTGPGPT